MENEELFSSKELLGISLVVNLAFVAIGFNALKNMEKHIMKMQKETKYKRNPDRNSIRFTLISLFMIFLTLYIPFSRLTGINFLEIEKVYIAIFIGTLVSLIFVTVYYLDRVYLLPKFIKDIID